jgi:hypothetical protein
MERHLQECALCADYLDQARATIAATGRLQIESITAARRAELLTAFAQVLQPPGNITSP